MYLKFIDQAIKYMRNETNDLPEVDENQEEIIKQLLGSLGKST